jgi:hypothetical protein
MWLAMILIPKSDNHWQITGAYRKPHTTSFSVLLFIFTLNMGERNRHEP